jgi:sugar phosphate isomerase/epimerase
MKQFKIGLQLYSVRDELEKDFEGTLKKVAEMGYEYVEFAGYYGKSAQEIKALLEQYGLKCISVHQGVEWFLEAGQAAADYLKTIGVKYSVVPWYAKENHKGAQGWEKTLINFARTAELLKNNGMKLGYHNHDFEFETYEGTYLLDWLYETFPGDLLEPEIDTCWVHYAGVNPAEYIRKYAGKLHVVHLKDFSCDKLGGGPVYALIDNDGKEQKKPTQADTGFRFRPLGEGIQNWPEILEACEQAGAELLIVEQDSWYEDTSLGAAARSRAYLKNTFGL